MANTRLGAVVLATVIEQNSKFSEWDVSSDHARGPVLQDDKLFELAP